MISIPVDEARAFDELSIQSIKALERPTADALDVLIVLAESIEDIVGVERFSEIKHSHEYDTLYLLNRRVFDAINRLKTEGEWVGAAIEIDQLNYQRYLAKQALQSRFFPTTPLTERKVGYKEDKV